MMAGTMKREASRSSTTLTGIAARLAQGGNPAIDGAPRRGHDDQARARKVLWNEFPVYQLDRARIGQGEEFGVNLGSNQGDPRPGARQQRGFAQRHLAAADDEHLLCSEIEK